MSIKKRILLSCLLAGLAMLPMQTIANNIDANSARNVANMFLKQQAASNKTFKSITQADLKLVYSEASSITSSAHAYYAFNIKGGGWIIISGEDRARQVLGFSDQGRLDFNKLPDNFKALMRGYKEEIEYLQANPDLKVSAPTLQATNGTVEPLIKAIWGQEWPYCMQCPVYQGEYCAVGCVATAMTQVMYYWKYPTSSPSLSSFYCYSIGQTVPSLPETTFDYNMMLTSYCHWDWDQSALIQDTYTDEQAQAVAKIARYCGQAVRMDYHPDGSGATVTSQLSAMKKFGFSSSAKNVSRSSWWSQNYTNEQWEAMIREELDARRPILYSADDVNGGGGHAFVCDGYNNNGMFHFNFGWYGTCDGWYTSTALNMTHRTGEVLKFNSGHEMLIGVKPPTFCFVEADAINVPSDLLVLGEEMPLEALNVNIFTSSDMVNFIFSIVNNNDMRIATSDPISITTTDFTQGSPLNKTITLPTTLEAGTYDLKFYYYINSARQPTLIDCEGGQLNIIGNMAKCNEPFTITDVTQCIDYLLNGTHPGLSINDLTVLTDALLSSN